MSEKKDYPLMRIPLASIRENPVALRSVNRQTEKYIAFAASIRQDGVMNAILVREIPSPEGTQLYGIIEGLHRYTASLDAGFKDIPAQVINMTDAQVMQAQLIGNAHRIETTPVEYSKHLQRILSSDPFLTMAQLAGKLSQSTTWLSERLGLLKLNESIHKLVDEGKINLTNAYSLAKLPEEEQQDFVDRAMTMTPQEFGPTVLARRSEINKANRQGRSADSATFVPVPHMQKLSDLKAEMESPTIGPVLVRENNITTADEGFALGVRWALRMDSRSIAAAKEKDEARKKQAKDEQAKAAAERAKKRADEAAAAVAKLQSAAEPATV